MKIALVIGHSSDSRGAYGNAGISEFQFWDELINEMSFRKMLPKNTYVFYRSSDVKGYTSQMWELHKRIDAVGCEVAIECHFNSFHRPEANGNEVLYCSEGGKKIADIFDEAFDSLPNRDRGVKKVTLKSRGGGFCCRGKSKAIIIEPFFGARQREYIHGGSNRELLLTAIKTGLERL